MSLWLWFFLAVGRKEGSVSAYQEGRNLEKGTGAG